MGHAKVVLRPGHSFELCQPTLSQQLKTLNSRINNPAPYSSSQTSAEAWKKRDPLAEDTMGDSSQSGDEEESGWKALR